MSEKPESNGPPPPLPETPARPPTPTEAPTHTKALSNGARLSTMPPALPLRVASAIPLTATAGVLPPPLPPPPPPPKSPSVKVEPAIKSEPVDTEFQPSQTQEKCQDYTRGSCSREGKFQYLQTNNSSQFCHDFQNKGCNRSYCKFFHATVSEEQAFHKTGKLPKAILERNRNGETQNCSLSTVDMNIVTRPPTPQSTTSHTVSLNARTSTNFNQGAGTDPVCPPLANLSRPPPAVPKWNSYIRPNGRPPIPPPPRTENFTRPPTHNMPPMNYFPPTNHPPPTAVIKDNNGWSTSSQQLSIKNDMLASDRNIGIKRTWSETGDNMNVSQSVSSGHKTLRMDFMGSCSNCKLLQSQLATSKSRIDELLKIVFEFEKWQKEAEKQKSLLEHISSIIGSNQIQSHAPLGDNVPNLGNALLNLGLPVASSLCTPHTQIQNGLDSQQITMQLPSLQLPQLLQIQRNLTSNDQQVRISNPPSIIGNGQNWSDSNLNGQQQSMVSVSYGNNQVMLHTPPGRQLTPQQQQVLQLLDSNGFSISYK